MNNVWGRFQCTIVISYAKHENENAIFNHYQKVYHPMDYYKHGNQLMSKANEHLKGNLFFIFKKTHQYKIGKRHLHNFFVLSKYIHSS